MSIGTSSLTVRIYSGDKRGLPESAPWFRNLVTVEIADAGVDASNLALLVYRGDTLVAACTSFSGTTASASGSLDLNTTEMEAVMSGVATGAVRAFDVYIWDTSTLGLIGRGLLNVRGTGSYSAANASGAVSVVSAGLTQETIDGINYFVLRDAAGVIYAKFPAPGAIPND